MKTMKYKALLVAISTIALMACECHHHYEYPVGREYELYARSVVDNVVRESADGLDCVLKIYEITEGKPETGRAYTVSDGYLHTISPIVCKVENKDTVWTYGSMRIRHSQLTDVWNVENKAEESNADGHKYNFSAEAKLESEPDSSHVRHPWIMTFSGTRIEKTAYSMQYKSETPISVTWDNYETFLDRGFDIRGEFIMNLKKGESTLDWIRATYSDAGQTYETSL